MSKEVIERLLGLEKNKSLVGTANERGTGLGIALNIDFLMAKWGS